MASASMSVTEDKKIQQFVVTGCLLSRGPVNFDELEKLGFGYLGYHYPAGPVIFLKKNHPTCPSIFKQFHHERLSPISCGPEEKELVSKASSWTFCIVRSGVWRMTECDDWYPAEIDQGKVIFAASDEEIKRLKRDNIHLNPQQQCTEKEENTASV